MSRLMMQEIIDRYEDLYKKIEVYGQFMKRLEKEHKLNPIEIATYKEYKLIAEWLKELQHYKDLEEQGRLIETIRCKDCKFFEGGYWCVMYSDTTYADGYCYRASAKLAELKGTEE